MIRAHRRSLLILGIALLTGLTGPSHAAGETKGNAMTAQADDNGTQPDAAPPSTTENMVVAPDELNDVDRSLREEQPSPPPPAAATAATAPPAPRAAPVMAAGGEHSVWDETSLIGKVFIGFGALLTVASAARMFIA